MTDRLCLECNKEFRALDAEVKRGGGKYCSRECYHLFQPKLLDQKFKHSKLTYDSVHIWIKAQLGRPSKCEDCGTEDAKRYDWANISKEYLRDTSDWKRLCRKCHIAFDNHPEKRRLTILERYGSSGYTKRDQATGRFVTT